MAEKILLECREVTKSYAKKPILKNINLKIPHGKIVGLLGSNGAGKTTLIKLCTGLLKPTSGKILINGRMVGPETKRMVSYLPEQQFLNQQTKIRQIIRYFADFYPDFSAKKAENLMADLKLDINDNLKHMSKGMQEKVQLCLVMSRKADLYILDEPLGGVDPATRDYIMDTILNNFDGGNASLIISTHLIADTERILDEVIFIKDGEILMTSEADALREKYEMSIDEIFRKEFKNV